MKKLIFTLLLLAQLTNIFAHERNGFVEKQQQQERIVKSAFETGRITENEYVKLMHQQKVIREAIETADIDHNWTAFEHNNVLAMLKRADKKIRKYSINTERY
jgi:hypothetical protein